MTDFEKNGLDESFDPLAGLTGEPADLSGAGAPAGGPASPEDRPVKKRIKKEKPAKEKARKSKASKGAEDGAPKEKKKLFGKKKKEKSSIVRVEDLDGDYEADVDDVISMYMPRRRTKLLAQALLRLDKMRMLLLIATLIVAILFIMSFMQEKMGNFTINLDRLELFRKGVAMDYDPNFSRPTARLTASPVEDATNITITDIPSDVDQIDGDHNGRNYMAYTYYVRNAGKEDVAYTASVVLASSAKSAEDAVRVAVWRNGERTIYAEPSADGTPEDGCENFYAPNIACRFVEENFQVGNVDKYTIVIWLEGEDPECVDAIVGGSVEFAMKIEAYNEDETTLLWKYISDIIDTITGDKPISAAGTESPDFQKYETVTWDTRRNQ
ncbi:MAG: hypothetical protein MJ186_07060 [Clostridia bacterium]|nr:hypothetical protein [Clostridia bacterium]